MAVRLYIQGVSGCLFALRFRAFRIASGKTLDASRMFQSFRVSRGSLRSHCVALHLYVAVVACVEEGAYRSICFAPRDRTACVGR